MTTKNINKQPAHPKPFVPLLPYQRRDIESSARFRWNCWARQTGKSFTKSLRRILRGLSRRRNQIFLSAGMRQSRELMLKARQHCRVLQIAAQYTNATYFNDMNFTAGEILLPGGVRIIGLPANPQTARGYTGDVLLDEFAMHRDDRDIWASLFPTLLRGDGELDIASTPKGKGNLFYDLRNNPRFSTDFLTLPDAIKQGLNIDMEALRQACGDDLLFRQEFLCEFIEEATALLSYDQILACVDEQLQPAHAVVDVPRDAGDLFIGVDIGRLRDLTVVWVLAITGDVLLTVGLFELSAAPFRAQQAMLHELLSLRCVRRCCIDASGLGMQLAEELLTRFGKHRVHPVTFTSSIKSALAGDLRIAVENHRIRIPNRDAVINDWHSVERSMTSSGHFRISAPRQEGSHADRFWAAALAVRAAHDAHATIESVNTRPLSFARSGAW